MTESFLVLMQVLVLAEIPLAVAALAFSLRLRRREGTRFLRRYLAARVVSATANGIVMWIPWYAGLGGMHRMDLYFYVWFAGSFAMTWYLYRTSHESLAQLLGPFSGLRRLGTGLYAWLAFPAALLVLPAAVRIVLVLCGRISATVSLDRFMTVYSFAQLLPVVVTLAVGLRLGLRAHHRLFGILLGLALEPAFDLVISLVGVRQVWGWQNFARQIVTDATLVLWMLYLSRRSSAAAPNAESSPTLQRWDVVARQIAGEKEEVLDAVSQQEGSRGPAALVSCGEQEIRS